MKTTDQICDELSALKAEYANSDTWDSELIKRITTLETELMKRALSENWEAIYK